MPHPQACFTSAGTIAARNIVQISAGSINDVGGRIQGNQVGLASVRDINISGGSVEAARTLLAYAGGDITIASTTNGSGGGPAPARPRATRSMG